MPLWGCDREQGGSAPNAVKNSSSPFSSERSLAETSGCYYLPSFNSLGHFQFGPDADIPREVPGTPVLGR
jgi:hypothetical protein